MAIYKMSTLQQYRAVQTFMTGLIDYAGLFPPANLSLVEAVDEYRRIVASEGAWMTNAFVIPCASLVELATLSLPPQMKLSVITTRAATIAEWQASIARDVATIERFLQEQEEVMIASFEVPLPPQFVSAAQLSAVCAPLSSFTEEWFVEMTTPFNREQLAVIHEVGAAFKYRTGGVTASLIPTVAQVADVIVATAELGVRTKFTAGLHHPIRMHRPEVDAPMHGFMNVFFAQMVAAKERSSVAEIADLLALEDRAAFRVEADALQFGTKRLTNEQLATYRRTAAISFGSCSFVEPTEELAQLIEEEQ